MFIVVVRAEVLPDKIDAFLELAKGNAAESRKEPANLQFDVSRGNDNPNVFGLYEVYKDEAGFKAHQATDHYAKWKETVGSLLVAPRVSEKYTAVSRA